LPKAGIVEWLGSTYGDNTAERLQMKLSKEVNEHTCPACNGTGFPEVKQPAQPGRKLYPVKCEACAGKGRIANAAN
jgi:DnaJ-class molecular chaperone